MGAKARALVIVAAASALAAGAAAAAAPVHKTFRLDAQNVSVQLPTGWGKVMRLDREWQWHAVAPGYVAHLYVNAIPTTKNFSVISAAYAAALKKPFAPGDPHWAFSSGPAHVASLPAIKISFRYRNLTVKSIPVEVATIYAFVHRGLFYVFDYVATPKQLTAMRPVFDQSIRTVRFLRGP